MARNVTGVDVGSRTSKFMRGHYKGNTFHVSDFAFVQHASGEFARGWSSAEIGFKPQTARVGVTGRDVNIRYTRVPRVPDWQLRKLMRFEVEEIGDQSGAEVASDFNVLPPLAEIEGEDVVLLAMARESLLDVHEQGLKELGGSLEAFSPNALALYNAWLRFGAIQEETVLLANIGHDNLDVILVRGPDLLFARNLSGGSKLFDDAIAQKFNVGPAKAEEIKIKLADLTPGAPPTERNAERASRACAGAAGQLLSLLQSTVMFCKSQVKLSNLRVDRALICGGGAGLRGLPEYLEKGMAVPVERFDPFRVVDTSGLDPEALASLESAPYASVVALGLATMASDPESYSVEILPASERKKREFMGGTLYMIAAAVLALAYLGYSGYRTKSELSTVSAEVRSLQSRLRRATDTDKRTRALLEENAELADDVSLLMAVSGAGEQMARALLVVEESLPQEFWVRELHSDWRFDEELGVERGAERPLVNVSGSAREGTHSSADLFRAFLGDLQTALPECRIKQTLSPSGDKFTVDLTMLGPVEEPSDEGTGDEEAGDEAADEEEGA